VSLSRAVSGAWDGVALALCPRLGVGVLPFSAVTRTEQDDEAAY